MKHKLLLRIIVGLVSGTMYAQSDFDFTQRWFNQSLYNPAATGNSFSTGLFLHSRLQWIGLNRAPVTIAGAFDYYNQNIHSGIGASIAADYIGVRQNYHFRAAYAYFLEVGKSGTLSMGLSAGLFIRGWHVKPEYMEDHGDLVVIYNEKKEYTPDFDFGVEYQGLFKAGIAIRHIGAAGLSNALYPPDFNIWSYVSSRFDLSEANIPVGIEPLAAFTWRANISRFEGGFLLYFLKFESRNTFSDIFWVGATYRTDHNIAVMGGINLTPELRIGYSFDYGFGKVASIANFGTHEIFIAWQFNRQTYKEDRPTYRFIKGL
jgi:type IX secretion system PorP/SprF family membrane protein